MSGAEGIAGLAIGAVGLSTLFTSCVDAFNIIVSARDFSYEFEVLCADLALQQLRFCIWGEVMGFVSRHPDSPTVCPQGLQNPQIQSTLFQTLRAIRLLLENASRTRSKFMFRPKSSSRALGLFGDTFRRFRSRVSRNDTQQHSLAAATKWAITSRERFREDIERLSSLLDGLERVSDALNVLDVQRSRMRTEIESIDDVESLRLIRDASTRNQRDISDTASQRLLSVENTSPADQKSVSNITQSYYTANEEQHEEIAQTPESDSSHWIGPHSMDLAQNERIGATLVKARSQMGIWKTSSKYAAYGSRLRAYDIQEMAGSGNFPPNLTHVRKLLVESAEGVNLWTKERPVIDCLSGSTRVRKEIERFFKDDVLTPGVICFPIDSNMSHLLAGIEGPPDTPYEGYCFWIEIRLLEDYPILPPRMRFLTRMYHPNIDSRGRICVDILALNWGPPIQLRTALLSICSLLDKPGLDDPLVPEIAEIYCQDFELFCKNARLCSARYASAEPATEEQGEESSREEGSGSPGAIGQSI